MVRGCHECLNYFYRRIEWQGAHQFSRVGRPPLSPPHTGHPGLCGGCKSLDPSQTPSVCLCVNQRSPSRAFFPQLKMLDPPPPNPSERCKVSVQIGVMQDEQSLCFSPEPPLRWMLTFLSLVHLGRENISLAYQPHLFLSNCADNTNFPCLFFFFIVVDFVIH